MSSNKTIKWIEAGKVFAKNAEGVYLCPECSQQNLEVEDIVDDSNMKEFSRVISCPQCGARNTLRLKRYGK